MDKEKKNHQVKEIRKTSIGLSQRFTQEWPIFM